MKKKVANYSIIILVLTFSFGLYQAWKESRNPFAFFKEKPQNVAGKSTKLNSNKNYVEASSAKIINQ